MFHIKIVCPDCTELLRILYSPIYGNVKRKDYANNSTLVPITLVLMRLRKNIGGSYVRMDITDAYKC